MSLSASRAITLIAMKESSERLEGHCVALDDLTIGYRTREGVRVVASGLNETIPPGAVTCLLGPNGAGKSTLLRTIANLQPPVSGCVRIDGKPVDRIGLHELSRLIGIVLTGRGSTTAMKTEELVGLGRTPYTNYWGHLTEEDRRIVDEAMTEVGADGLRGRRVASLSDGEMQKVMIAKTLAQQTPVIMLDEPTAFLDFPGKVELMRLLRRLAENDGKTIFLSTHDLDIALATTDYVWLLDRDGSLETGDVETVGRAGSLDRLFACRGLRYNPSMRHFEIK